MPFKAIEPRRLYQLVAEQLVAIIRAEEYPAGSRLPPERELVRRLGVSRPVIREAMIALEIAGFVSIRIGSGVYVRNARGRISLLDQGLGPFDAIVARLAVEVAAAGLAAEHATPEDLVELSDALEVMRAAERPDRYTNEGDRRFHLAVAAASHNAVFVRICHLMWDEMLDRGPIWERFQAARAVRPRRIAEHAAIVSAIAARDAAAAREAMRLHIEGTRSLLLAETAPDACEVERSIA